MRILVTCPPMLRNMATLEARFTTRGMALSLPEVTQTLSVEELVELVPNHDGWIIGDDPVTSRVLRAATAGRLKAAVKWGVGTDNIDFSAASEVGLNIPNTPQMFGEEVADVALAYVIGLARHLFAIHVDTVAGAWSKPTGISLRGRTVLLVGFGDIGRQLGARLTTLGMDIVVYDPGVDFADFSTGFSPGTWPDALATADFVVFTCALTAQNRHMLNTAAFAHAKKGINVVNVARGPLIDEIALADALADGLVAGAALDVFEQEPLPIDSPLRASGRCVFGSHNGSNTSDAVLRASHRAIDLLFESLGVDR